MALKDNLFRLLALNIMQPFKFILNVWVCLHPYILPILDGIAIAAIFNGIVATLVLINPRYFFDSYPKAILKAAPKQMTKKEVS